MDDQLPAAEAHSLSDTFVAVRLDTILPLAPRDTSPDANDTSLLPSVLGAGAHATALKLASDFHCYEALARLAEAELSQMEAVAAEVRWVQLELAPRAGPACPQAAVAVVPRPHP